MTHVLATAQNVLAQSGGGLVNYHRIVDSVFVDGLLVQCHADDLERSRCPWHELIVGGQSPFLGILQRV